MKDMVRKDYETLFSHLKPPLPREDLSARTMLCIKRAEYLQGLKWRFAVFVLMLFGTGAAAVPAFQSVQSSLAESGALQFLSLFFSDFNAVATYWQSFAFALLESVPVVSIVVLLSLVLIFLQLLRFIAEDLRGIASPLPVN